MTDFSPRELEIVARFEGAPTLVEAWEPDDTFAVGDAVTVYEVNGGYLVAPRNRGMGLT